MISILDENLFVRSRVPANKVKDYLRTAQLVERTRIGREFLIATSALDTQVTTYTEVNAYKSSVQLESDIKTALQQNRFVFLTLGRTALRDFYSVAGFSTFLTELLKRLGKCEVGLEPALIDNQLIAGIRRLT